MTDKQPFNIEFVAKLLLKRGLISEDQYKDIIIKGGAQRARLQKYQESSHARRGLHVYGGKQGQRPFNALMNKGFTAF